MGSTPDRFSARLKELQQRFADSLPERLQEVERDLATCLDAGQTPKPWIKLRSRLHEIAGSAGGFGFSALTTTARALEDLVVGLVGSGGVASEEQRAQVALLEDAVKESAKQPDEDFLRSVSAAARAAGPREATAGPRTVFVLDADPAASSELAAELAGFGYTAVTLARFDELEARVAEALPAALVTAVELVDDLAMAHLIRARRQRMLPIPLVALAAVGDFRSRLAAVRSEAAALLTRPLDVLSLVERLDHLTSLEEAEPHRVLIIDDSKALASFYSLVLERAGMTTAVVTDPANALEAVQQLHPTLILLDLNLPRCSGFEVAAVLRQLDELAAVPIVYLSGERDVTTQLDAMRVAGDGFLTKPIRPEHLVSAVVARAEQGRALRSMVVRDKVTGLLSHAHLMERLQAEVASAASRQGQLALALVEVDRLAEVNAAHGYAAGDHLLRELARHLRSRLGRTDLIGRYGGAVLAAVLLDAASAARTMDEVRASFAAAAHNSMQLHATVSCGLAGFPACLDPAALTRAATAALRRAEAAGGNTVAVAQTGEAAAIA